MNDKELNTSLNNQQARIATFQAATKNMIAKNAEAYRGDWASRFHTKRTKNLTPSEIDNIIDSGSLSEQQWLSENYFRRNGFYKRLLIYYANLYEYIGLLLPNPNYKKDLSQDFIQKKYFQATRFIDKNSFKDLFSHFALQSLIKGCYYGVIQSFDQENLTILDLPVKYCCSRYKNKKGIDLIEFDVSFFDTITDPEVKNTTLKVYPKNVRNWYQKWKRGDVTSKWAFIPAEIGICFPFYDGAPLFLNVIKAVDDYEAMVDNDIEKAEDEVKKILVQKIPHLNDGTLLFEPPEAQVMHDGAVGMLRVNKNVSVLTTYGDIDAIVSKTTSDSNNTVIERMAANVYNEAGTSSQLFNSNSNLALKLSIQNDMKLMTPLINKFEKWVTELVNRLYSNTNITFTYKILPITEYNKDEFIDNSFKLATSGYSFLMPALAMGISQSEIGNLKDLENNILKLNDKLIPLASSYTSSGKPSSDEGGRPKKKDDETSDKTEKNKISMEGGSN